MSQGRKNSVDNPTPQKPVIVDATAGTNGDKVVLVMVGLPGTGKTHIARRVARYLEYFHGARTRTFNLAEYRRRKFGPKADVSFFDAENGEGLTARQALAVEAMEDLKTWMQSENTLGRVAVFDGTNSTKERRSWILQELNEYVGQKVIFIESICEDEGLIRSNIHETQLRMPDYEGMSEEDAVADFLARREQYKRNYASVEDQSQRWIKVIDSGRQVVANRIEGFLPGRVLNYLMCLHTTPHSIYLSRHGQSEYNEAGKIGGDSGLTMRGKEYAAALAEYASEHICKDENGEPVRARLWTSSMRRTIETASLIPHPVLEDGWVQMRPRQWRALDELYAGQCDGMTYKEIEEFMPEEFSARSADKVGYRYPRGESYLDVITRLDPVLHELERQKGPVLIVGHQGILRIIAAYFTGLSRAEAVTSSMPLHTVVKLTPSTYGCEVEKNTLTVMPNQAAIHAPSC